MFDVDRYAVDLVTDVAWDAVGLTLDQTKREFFLELCDATETESEILDGEEC